jgi:hypothetical protein
MAINFNNMMEHERSISDRTARGEAVSRIVDNTFSIYLDPTDAWVVSVEVSDFSIQFKDVDILY